MVTDWPGHVYPHPHQISVTLFCAKSTQLFGFKIDSLSFLFRTTCPSPISSAETSAPAGDAPLMPHFSPMRNGGKNRQRRGLPPPCGIHPAVLDVPAFSSLRPLARRGHIDGMDILQNVPVSLADSTSIARALPWYATVPSCRKPGSRRRERRFSGVGPDMETTRL